jgi:Ca2+-transporting ATPase
MAFFALGATQLAVAAGSRVRPGTLANPALLAAIATALGLQFAALYLPLLNNLLKTEPLSATDLAIVCALSTLGYAAVRLDRIVHRDKPPGGAAVVAGGRGHHPPGRRQPGTRPGPDRTAGATPSAPTGASEAG